MRTISFLNMKGGVGKTTTSINVAAGLASKGYTVLLIDYDPQGNTTSMFENEIPNTTISTLMVDGGTADQAMIEVQDRLWLIPSELALANAEMDLRMQANAPQHNRLQRIIRPVSNRFDFCIIDCAPIINLLTVNAIMVSNEIIVPIKPDKFAIQGFNVTIKNLKQVCENFELDIDYKILFTIVNKNNEEKNLMSQVTKIVGPKRVFKTVIRNQPKPVISASSRNQMVINDNKAKVAEDLKELVQEILEG